MGAAISSAESDQGSLLLGSCWDPPVQTRESVPGQLLSVSLRPAPSETALGSAEPWRRGSPDFKQSLGWPPLPLQELAGEDKAALWELSGRAAVNPRGALGDFGSRSSPHIPVLEGI